MTRGTFGVTVTLPSVGTSDTHVRPGVRRIGWPVAASVHVVTAFCDGLSQRAATVRPSQPTTALPRTGDHGLVDLRRRCDP